MNPDPPLRPWVVALILSAIGCDAEGPPPRVHATIEVTSADPTNPHEVDFGEVDFGDSREEELTITNVGPDTLQIHDLALPPGTLNFEILNRGDLDPPILAPGARFVLQIAYHPVRDEHVESTLTVASNDSDHPTVPVRLVAEGLAPAIEIHPPTWDFGDSALGCGQEVDLQLRNVGRQPLVLTVLEFEDLVNTGEWSLTYVPSPQTMLDPGQAALATVKYAPMDATPAAGVLHVHSNDPYRPDAMATLSGMAHFGETRIDTFHQEANNRADILWVVDNSPSMVEEQQHIAHHMAQFMDIIGTLDLDYQIGVTTTDVPAQQGHLVGSPRIITPSTPDPSGTLQARAEVGIGSSNSEQGLEASDEALEDSINGGLNAGFLRDDASLYVIHVSDDEDESFGTAFPGHGPWDAVDYVAYYQGLKADPGQVVVSDITGGVGGCATANPGGGYLYVTQLTGGVSSSICDADWSPALQAIGWSVPGLSSRFGLSRDPVPGTIEVHIDAAPVVIGWTYNPAHHAVEFDANHVPVGGVTVEIEYTAWESCSD